MQCAQCATPVPRDARFCHNCGSQVSDAEGQAAATAAMDDSSVRHMERLLREDTQGEFEILHQIGRGGMAVVYLANEVHLGRRVAIKVLPPELTFGHGVERFKREAKTAAALDHPNIIPIFRIATGGKIFWYAMKYLEGRTLDAAIRVEGRIPLDEAIAILDAVAEALDYAHDHDVVHRDVKPANVMLDGRNRVVVTDFGIAKPLTETTLTASGSLVGTPYYMSPEQGMGKPVTGASDLYSVAVMAYHMIAGQVPFEGTSAIEVLHKHCTAAPPPIDELCPGLPDYVHYAVHRALSKEANGRFGTVGEFVAALRRPAPGFVAGRVTEPVTAAGTPTPVGPTAAPNSHPLAPSPEPAALSATVQEPPTERMPAVRPAPAVRPPGVAKRRSSVPLVATLVLVGVLAGVTAWVALGNRGVADVPVTEPFDPAAGGGGPGSVPAGEAGPPATRGDPATGGPPSAMASDTAAAAAAGLPTAAAPPARGDLRTGAEEAARPAAATVAIVAGATSMPWGDTQTLAAQVRDAGGNALPDRPVSWTSSDPSVATVDAVGRVQAVAPGSATINAAVEGRRQTLRLTVSDRVTAVRLAAGDTTLDVGASAAFTATTAGWRGRRLDAAVRWESSNAAVARVDGNGRVTALAEGRAQIVARSGAAADTLTVRVSAPRQAADEKAGNAAAAGPSDVAEARIRELVEGYVGLLNARDAGRVSQVYPTETAQDQRARTALLGLMTNRDRDFSATGPSAIESRVGDGAAVATFVVRIRTRNNFGAYSTRDVTFIAELRPRGNTWQMVSCKMDPSSRL